MPSLTVKQRLEKYKEINENGCWVWQRRIKTNGYGEIAVGSRFEGNVRNALAHRVSYEEFKGKIPDGLEIDHLCKNRACINPEHLEAVTHKENVHRSNALWKQFAARTHCSKGHEYTPDNIYKASKGNGRNCRTCMRKTTYDRYWARKNALEGGL